MARTIKLFGKKIDSIRLHGKDYPVKKNMCLKLKKWNQIYEQYDYFYLRGIKEIASFLGSMQY